MAEQQTSIFRKQSIESISSPEQLNDYIKSASPSVWFILTAVIFLLAGVFVWSIFGHIDTVVTAGSSCKNGILTLYIPEKYDETLKTGMTVTAEGREYTISEITTVPVLLTDATDPYVLHISGLSAGEFCMIATAQTDLPDGIYSAVVTFDSVAPISFITN